MTQFQKSTFTNEPINLAVLYRSPSPPQVNFVNCLINIVEKKNIDILLGNFNINAIHYALLNMTLQRF